MLHYHYLSGVGGIYTGTGFVKPTLGVEINAYMNQNTSKVCDRKNLTTQKYLDMVWILMIKYLMLIFMVTYG